METLFKEYAIPFTMRPLAKGDAAKALDIAKEVHDMPEPVTVIVPFTPLEDGKTLPPVPNPHIDAAIQFLSAYARVAPASFAAKPSWHLNHAAKAGLDTTEGTVER